MIQTFVALQARNQSRLAEVFQSANLEPKGQVKLAQSVSHLQADRPYAIFGSLRGEVCL